jgi:hypothetical protein
VRRRLDYRAGNRQADGGHRRFDQPAGPKSPHLDDGAAGEHERHERNQLDASRSAFDRLEIRFTPDSGARPEQQRLVGAGAECIAGGDDQT